MVQFDKGPFTCYVMHWGCGVYGSVQISVTKVHAPTLLALQSWLRSGGGSCPISKKNHYVTLEWPLNCNWCISLDTALILALNEQLYFLFDVFQADHGRV